MCWSERARKKEQLTNTVNTYREEGSFSCSRGIMGVDGDQLINNMLH